MKKRIFKQKPVKNNYNADRRKTIYRNTKHRAGKAAMVLVLSLLAGSIFPVYAQEAKASKVVITEIFHRHVGTSSAKGGCYQVEIPHVHDGDEVHGGACFLGEREHVHQGDEASGTGCYTHPVLHTHQGNEGQEGACFRAVYHVHEDGCYKNEICTINYAKGDLIETFTDECDTHGETAFDKISGTASHKDCAVGVEEIIMEYCQICGPMSYSYHTYSTVVCGMDTQQPIGYEKICGKEEGDIEGYETGCGFTEGQTESYIRTCEKAVDGYERNCGLDENTPCGRMVVTNETDGEQEKVTVSVKFEDLSGGKLILDDDPFHWFDEKGKNIGNGDQIEVEENGNYTVELKLKNRDVDESGLRSSMLVDNVLEKSLDDGNQSPSPSASPSSGNGDGGTSPSPNQTPEGGDQGGDGTDDGEDDFPMPVPSVTPAPALSISPDQGDDHADENATGRRRVAESSGQEEEEEAEEIEEKESPSPAITLKKEIGQKRSEEKMESAPVLPEVKEVSRIKDFFSIPAVRVITIAAGTLLLLAGLLLLLLYLRKSVRLYNDDGEGRWIYLGRLVVRQEEEGYAVTISEKAEEKAYTNRYCIRPGLFRLGKGEQEIFVYKDTERVSASLEKEMMVVL